MQFLWKYIDEILGKGLSIFEMVELIFYYAVTLIPMAVPITVLISSVMVFGDISEKYELSSMKSAGISLIRVMLPGVVISCLIALFSILASNYLKPAALLQFNKRFISIRKQKSALAIEEGIFNDAFDETIIQVEKIDKNKRDIHDILIYDHTGGDKSLIKVTSADSGRMFTTPDGRYFVMELNSGVNYQEMDRKSSPNSNRLEIPFSRTYFDKWSVVFDMNAYGGDQGFLNFNRDRDQMMNTKQLLVAIDSFTNTINNLDFEIGSRVSKLMATPVSPPPDVLKIDQRRTIITKSESEPAVNSDNSIPTLSAEEVSAALAKKKEILPDSENIPDESESIIETVSQPRIVVQEPGYTPKQSEHWIMSIDSLDFREVISKAQSMLSSDRDDIVNLSSTKNDFNRQKEKYLLRLNQQYSWAFVCIIFLFIGAPLGSIIRKGGYGYPLLFAILFYMMFIISTIHGEKLVRSNHMGGIEAAWTSCLFLTPFAVLLTYMALRDIKFNASSFIAFIVRWIPQPILNLFQKNKEEAQ